MGAAQLAISEYERDARIRHYRTDPIIEMFRDRIFKIISLAQPRIVINIEEPKKSVFEIDQQSQDQLKYWKQQMEEYILSAYSDIIKLEKQ